MAIPVYLQQFKAAGIYRVVFDKSTVAGVDSEILRLVVGYSEKGPFNIPTYITSVSNFKAMYGDISKKLEKRGIYFHRAAMQALASGPILALNLKKFNGETVDGASINTDFNPVFEPIDTVKLSVEDIYDTSRFWELSAEKLDNLKAVDGSVMDQYINICATNTKGTGATYFIRKAAGTKVSGYNLTVSDWYADGTEEMPDYLSNYKNSLMSDFFAEIYVFKGQFSASQVLASSTLKNYFETLTDANGKPVVDDNGEIQLKLRSHLTNAFGDYVDTLDALYNDSSSNPLGHYVGSLIPNMKNKYGAYVALDILFNSDQDTHNLMMSFNVDNLEEEGTAHIDLSGRLSIPDPSAILGSSTLAASNVTLDKLFAGTATTTLLGNADAPVDSAVLKWSSNVVTTDVDGALVPVISLSSTAKKIMGTLVVSNVSVDAANTSITLHQVGAAKNDGDVEISLSSVGEVYQTAYKLGAAYTVSSADVAAYTVSVNGVDTHYALYSTGHGTVWTSGDPFITPSVAATSTSAAVAATFNGEGPEKVVTSIARIEQVEANDYSDSDMNMKVSLLEATVETEEVNPITSVYGTSVTFIPCNDGWFGADGKVQTYEGAYALISDAIEEKTLYSFLQVGDCLLADDGSTDRDDNGIVDEDEGKTDNFCDNVYVQEIKTVTDDNGQILKYVIKVSGNPMVYDTTDGSYLIRVDGALNREMGTMVPQFLDGYTFKHNKPESTGMYSKLEWQKEILSTLTEYKGLRTGLLNKSDIDYRYIVDTFETFVDTEAKSVLSYLAKEKQSAFALLNFPSVKTFVKCPYTSFTDSKGVFDVNYVVAGYNKKKAAGVRFSLPTDSNGASFCAFYSPVKFSDGYVDTIVPSAALVSNLFIDKYSSRQPYYIIAGPNYGNISASGLVGPDYNYSQDELQIIEPFGVNCMVYRPSFGTFINANQTAKQTPVSALSKVNVRELVIYLQDEIEKVLQAYQWEFNNATTRTAILDKANAICSRIQANGGIQAYLNVMDESNNTPEIIDNEMAVLSTHIEPGMGCGKMVQELTLYRTGQMSSSISD